jgi:hypothetical protein
LEKKDHMDDEFLDAVQKTADTSFDASAPTNSTDASAPTKSNGDPITCPVVLSLLAKPRFATRRSGSKAQGFLDGEYKSVEPEVRPIYRGYATSGRTPNDEDKRGAWQLQEEYLAGRLGKNEEENGKLWNTVKWIDRNYRIATTPAEALSPLNIYVGDKISQTTVGTAPTGPDDEAPDEVANKGVEFESINVGKADSELDQEARWWKLLPDGSIKVMDEDGTTHRLDIKTDDYAVMRLVDALGEIDESAKIDVNDLMREAPPLLPQTDFPSSDQRAESGKIIRILMLGMRSLWHPVIRAIASHADMKSLSQGKGKDVAAAVGRQRVIEGLRLAESIRRGLGRNARQTIVHRPGFSVDDIIRETLAILPDKSLPKLVEIVHIIKTAPIVSMPMILDFDPVKAKPLPSNDNLHTADVALAA